MRSDALLCYRCGSYNPENAQKCSVCGQSFVDESGKSVGPVRKTLPQQPTPGIFVPGEMVAGRYRIAELLGQGGVGAVFRARDTEIDVDVALKGISANLLQTDEEQRNFQKQIRAARKLQHPNIVRVYDEGQASTANRRFFTMKLLEGLTLRKIIRLRHEKGQPFSAEELTPIFHQLGSALDYAHKTTWHGDLKPENIIILPDLLKVTDFHLLRALPLKPFLGIAKARAKGFFYIAPELRVESQSIDGRADIYSLGVILAEMLTGIVYEGHFSRAMTAALERLPTRLDGLVRRALTEHPDGRFAKASDMARELEQALAQATGPLPAPGKNDAAKPDAASAPAKKPPPPPLETSPSQMPVPSPVAPRVTPPVAVPLADDVSAEAPAELNSADLMSAEARSDEKEPSELLEIGQSQVMLLEGDAGHGVRIVADEQRAAPNDANTSTNLLFSGEPPRDPEQLMRALESESRGDDFEPPPVPEVPEEDSQVGMSRPPAKPIHEERTSLVVHPRPDLLASAPMTEEAKRIETADARTVLHDERTSLPDSSLPMTRPMQAKAELPPPLGDDDSLKETASVQGRRPAVSLPPMPAEPTAAVLRPVAPPRAKRDQTWLIAAVALLGVGIVLLLLALLRRSDADQAVVTERTEVKAPETPTAPATPPEAPEVPAVADAGTTAVVPVKVPPKQPEPSTKTEKAPAPAETLARATPKEDPKPATPPVASPAPPPPAVNNTGTCPKNMVQIDGGNFVLGSESSDPMRNFGEAAASNVEMGRVCIDYYEYPNNKGVVPVTGVTWQAAKTACEKAGKRLCTEREWERACKGSNNSRFPYGNSYSVDACNTADASGNPRELARPVDFKQCRSGFKVFMMAGNAEEWVADTVNGQKLAKGGAADRPDFSSRCAARRLISARTTSQTLGFRCCADPQ